MAFPSSYLDRFKIETEFGDGYVVQTTYDWELSAKVAKQSKWTDVERIGLGAFGSVWLEKEEPGGQLRAVKRLQHDTLNRRSFTRELQALITLGEHKHLFVEFLGWYENKHNVFLAMEYIKYGDLRVYMRDFEIVEAEACEITAQILDGLKILHGEGICHRDLKPENILVASRDPIWVKLADFGISKRTNNTYLRTRCGTVNYLAPELLGLLPSELRAGSRFTFALDMWSLGCIVHELLTSQIPFLQPAQDGYDDVTEDETSDEEIGAELDIGLLFQYCQGHVGFPSDVLHTSEVSEEGIAFVENLLAPNPTVRATAASALDTPWLARPVFPSPWFKDLVTNFSTLGIELSAPNGRESMKQLPSSDITLLLPSTADFRVLLEQALINGYTTAAVMLLKTRSLRPVGGSIVRGLVKHAVTNGQLGFLKLLCSIKEDDNSSWGDLLHDALNKGFTDIVQFLVDHKVNGNSCLNGRTVLLAAVEHGNLDIVKEILKNGADVNAVPNDSDGLSALQAAVAGGQLDIVKILLIHGANINAHPGKGRTALQAAAEGGHYEIVALLLDKGANVNAQAAESNGRTAMQAAAGGGHLEIVALLCDKGGNVHAPGARYFGRTAIQAAAEGGHLDIAKLLLGKQANVNALPYPDRPRALQAAAAGGHLDMVTFLLIHGANINAAAPDTLKGRTALQGAAEEGHHEIVALLLDKGANVNAPGARQCGRTAIQVAAEGGHLGIAALLLAKGADVSAPGAEYHGRTAIQAAAGGGHLDMAQLLLDNQANVNARPCSNDGFTALHAATCGGDIDMVRLLLNHNAHDEFALYNAVVNGYLDIVKLLLDDNNRSYFEEYLDGLSPLLSSLVDERNVEMIKLLLDHDVILTQTVVDQMINVGLDDLVRQYPQNRTRALEMEPRVVD